MRITAQQQIIAAHSVGREVALALQRRKTARQALAERKHHTHISVATTTKFISLYIQYRTFSSLQCRILFSCPKIQKCAPNNSSDIKPINFPYLIAKDLGSLCRVTQSHSQTQNTHSHLLLISITSFVENQGQGLQRLNFTDERYPVTDEYCNKPEFLSCGNERKG